MKRITLATLFLAALFLIPTQGFCLKTYNVTGLTGGTSRDLDYLSVDDLSDGDRAIGFVESGSSRYYHYFEYDATGTTAEGTSTHPYHIRPDDYATGGVWVEASVDWVEFDSSLSVQNLTVTNTLSVNDISATGDVAATGKLSGSLPMTDLKNNTTHTISGVSKEGGICTNWLDTSGNSGSTVYIDDGVVGDSLVVKLSRSTQVGSGSGNTIWVTFKNDQTVNTSEGDFVTGTGSGTSLYELSGTTGQSVSLIAASADVWDVWTNGSPTEATEP